MRRRSISRKNKKRKGQLSQRVERSLPFRKFLKKKIGINMDEYHRGRWVSPQQAVAVSYSQARKKFSKK